MIVLRLSLRGLLRAALVLGGLLAVAVGIWHDATLAPDVAGQLLGDAAGMLAAISALSLIRHGGWPGRNTRWQTSAQVWLLLLALAVMVTDAAREQTSHIPYVVTLAGYYAVLLGAAIAVTGRRARDLSNGLLAGLLLAELAIALLLAAVIVRANTVEVGASISTAGLLVLAAAILTPVAVDCAHQLHLLRYYRALEPLWRRIAQAVPAIEQRALAGDTPESALHLRVISILDGQHVLRSYAPPYIRAAALADAERSDPDTAQQIAESAELAAGLQAREAGQPRLHAERPTAAPVHDTVATARWLLVVADHLPSQR
jgi:hypothetical protein